MPFIAVGRAKSRQINLLYIQVNGKRIRQHCNDGFSEFIRVIYSEGMIVKICFVQLTFMTVYVADFILLVILVYDFMSIIQLEVCKQLSLVKRQRATFYASASESSGQ
jgi:hypothetical protein